MAEESPRIDGEEVDLQLGETPKYVPRFDKLTEEQKEDLYAELAKIQRIQKELGLEQKGPSLSS